LGVGVPPDVREAENALAQLASVFFHAKEDEDHPLRELLEERGMPERRAEAWPAVAAHYRVLVEQIPAVVFMAFLDKGVGEAFVSPQIEALLGFSQDEWLRNPIRLYEQIHPEDKERWSVEAAEMFVTGEPLRSVYRVVARDGRVVWFHCEVNIVR
jgi:PAS domain S-box-containing protein